MNFKIKVLSPLHIGCGETYSGLNYIVDENRLFYFEPDKLFEFFGNKVETYVKWLEEQSNKVSEFQEAVYKAKIQEKKEVRKKLNDIKRLFHLKKFCQNNQIDLKSLKQLSAYSLPLKERIYDSEDVNKFIVQYYSPYIPGTEIKGAIRTAILYDIMKNNQEHYDDLKSDIQKFYNNFKDNKDKIEAVKNQRDLDKRIQEIGNKKIRKIKDDLNKNMAKLSERLEEKAFNSLDNQRDAKYDMLKYLVISDSNLKKSDETLAVAYATPFNTSRFFQTFYEYAKPGSIFEFKEIKSFENLDSNQRNQINEKLKFTEQQKTYFSLNRILKCCYDFSSALLEHETEFFESNKNHNIVSHLNMISNENRESSPVLRIGKDEGYLSLTIGLLIKEKDPELYKDVLIHTTKGTSYDFLFPKSRKIVHYDGKECTSGWVKFLPEGYKETEPVSSKQTEKINKKPASQESMNALMEKFGRKK
ncbi:MAG: type III-A CRISPR-associated RAMP protein Csm5 [Desulfobacteraceae bacterium IS3]|nr:MAG: type III-A CRISPR-associated RAMP protein Csm5 [Desulfobacteraceae bacterium IS3]